MNWGRVRCNLNELNQIILDGMQASVFFKTSQMIPMYSQYWESHGGKMRETYLLKVWERGQGTMTTAVSLGRLLHLWYIWDIVVCFLCEAWKCGFIAGFSVLPQLLRYPYNDKVWGNMSLYIIFANCKDLNNAIVFNQIRTQYYYIK